MALSATLMVAEKLLLALGLKVTLMVQLAPMASVDVQPLVIVKFEGFVPPSVTVMPVSGAVPEFLSVTGMAVVVVPVCTLPKFTAEVRVAPGVPAMPVPERLTVCTVLTSLSHKVIVPLEAVRVVGV